MTRRCANETRIMPIRMKCSDGSDILHQEGRGQVNTTHQQHSLPQAQRPANKQHTSQSINIATIIYNFRSDWCDPVTRMETNRISTKKKKCWNTHEVLERPTDSRRKNRPEDLITTVLYIEYLYLLWWGGHCCPMHCDLFFKDLLCSPEFRYY